MGNLYAPPGASLERPVERGDTYLFALNGRIGRYRWLAYTCTGIFLAFVITAIIGVQRARQSPQAIDNASLALGVLAILIVCIMSRRRMQDLGIAQAQMLLALVPVVNLYFLFVMAFQAGNDAANRYGPVPRDHDAAAYMMIFPVAIVWAAIAYIFHVAWIALQ